MISVNIFNVEELVVIGRVSNMDNDAIATVELAGEQLRAAFLVSCTELEEELGHWPEIGDTVELKIR